MQGKWEGGGAVLPALWDGGSGSSSSAGGRGGAGRDLHFERISGCLWRTERDDDAWLVTYWNFLIKKKKKKRWAHLPSHKVLLGSDVHSDESAQSPQHWQSQAKTGEVGSPSPPDPHSLHPHPC